MLEKSAIEFSKEGLANENKTLQIASLQSSQSIQKLQAETGQSQRQNDLLMDSNHQLKQ